MHRRSLLQLLGAAAAALPWRSSLAQAHAAPLTDAAYTTLRALAPAVLPSELGSKGADAVVDRFLTWLRGYRSGADMGFGYGLVRQRLTPTITPSDYVQQLDALERSAAAAGGSLSSLPLEGRRRVVAANLEAAGVKDFPASPDGKHAIADFMSFFFNSTEANDLCYRAKIGRDRCRTLTGSSARPAAFTGD
ncbi:MAG: hypothetical protein LC791_15495 [Acidobacteria bacterium]|nr:hypothetical protein [Acidobacteriota bacterium]